MRQKAWMQSLNKVWVEGNRSSLPLSLCIFNRLRLRYLRPTVGMGANNEVKSCNQLSASLIHKYGQIF